MIYLIISNMQHQDSLLLALQKFVMKCESWYDAEIAQLQSSLSPYTIPRTAVFSFTIYESWTK